MDIFTHAFAGASVGYAFGEPILGALLGCVADLPLAGKPRQKLPPELYYLTHNLLFVFAVGCMLVPFFGAWVFLPLISHLLLDLTTHEGYWAVRLAYPLSSSGWPWSKEWEFFNSSWWFGFIAALLWSVIWIL